MIYLADTVTKVAGKAKGEVLVCGSHGGLYPGYLAAREAVKGVIFNDAGGGLDAAGIDSLAYLEERGIAAATVGNMTCRIGDAADMIARGKITHVNAIAAALGVITGDTCEAAAQKLDAALPPLPADPGAFVEARNIYASGAKRRIVLIDSASLVKPEDRDQIVVTGSHGGLLGGDDFLALQVDAFAGVFHDAGIGVENAGITRLAALDRRGIAGITVKGSSARIGDARSVLKDGVISRVNERARALGALSGERLAERLRSWAG